MYTRSTLQRRKSDSIIPTVFICDCRNLEIMFTVQERTSIITNIVTNFLLSGCILGRKAWKHGFTLNMPTQIQDKE